MGILSRSLFSAFLEDGRTGGLRVTGKCPQNSECEKNTHEDKGFLSHRLKPKPTCLLLRCPKPMQSRHGWRREVEIHRTGPASSWAGDKDQGHTGILSLGEVRLGMRPTESSDLFQGLSDDFLESFPTLVPNPAHQPPSYQQLQLCMRPDTGNGVSRAGVLGE